MSENSISYKLDAATVIRRVLFFLLLVILTLGHLLLMFRGLNTPEAMDQAQIAREISRNNGFSTKCIRPTAYAQHIATNKTDASIIGMKDTFHSPLNPLVEAAVFKLIGANDVEKYKMGNGEYIYTLDRVVVAISTTFFLLSIGVSYLLIAQIFDGKIAGVTALLMLCCELMWNFSLSGLPQMLMLFLFTTGLYFTYKAMEAAMEGKVGMTSALVAGFFFCLMSLAHYMGIWILIGYIIFAGIAFRPRGLVALGVLAIAVVIFAFPMINNYKQSGTIMGSAFLVLYDGLGGENAMVMRNVDLTSSPLRLDGLMLKLIRTTILQTSEILPFLGSIVAAPLFFISLLHPFKRPSIAKFRWAILIMWSFAALGMSIFGVQSSGTHPNQIHILFAPIMTAYGLAILSILWSRLEFLTAVPMFKNAHLVLIVLLSATPILLGSYDAARVGLYLKDKMIPQWPPYFPPALEYYMRQQNVIKEDQIVVSDQPWAVAWYSDRTSIWLPKSIKDFEYLEEHAHNLGTPFAGILITPSSHGMKNIREIKTEYSDFLSLVLDGQVYAATSPDNIAIFDRDSKLKNIHAKYQHRVGVLGMDMIYYSASPLRSVEQN